jgi:hypothetical protein
MWRCRIRHRSGCRGRRWLFVHSRSHGRMRRGLDTLGVVRRRFAGVADRLDGASGRRRAGSAECARKVAGRGHAGSAAAGQGQRGLRRGHRRQRGG